MHTTDLIMKKYCCSHSLGGTIALSLEKQYKKEGNNPFGIVQSKSFGAPTVSGNIKPPLFKKET